MIPLPLTAVLEAGVLYSQEPEGLTSRVDSHIICLFFLTQNLSGTWFQDLHCCLGNEKSHEKREPQVWSSNPTADNIQQV